MPKHVRMYVSELGSPADGCDQIVDGLAGHGLAALRGEQPSQLVVAGRKVAFAGAQLVALDTLLVATDPLRLATQHPACFRSSWSRRATTASETRRRGGTSSGAILRAATELGRTLA